jgi:hypothetical protein
MKTALGRFFCNPVSAGFRIPLGNVFYPIHTFSVFAVRIYARRCTISYRNSRTAL